MEDFMEECFHHDKKIKKKGFEHGGCVIRWETPCAGTPDSVPEGFICPDAYIPISQVIRASENAKRKKLKK